MPKEQAGASGFQMQDPPDETIADAQSLSRIDFGTFVLSLSTSAMMHMRAIPDAEQAEAPENIPKPNLALASQTIAILEMIEEKTKGNLEPQEAELLVNVLHEVRMRFVEARKT